MHTSTFINCIPSYAHTICAYFKYPPKVTFITSIQYLSTFFGRKKSFLHSFLFISTLFTFRGTSMYYVSTKGGGGGPAKCLLLLMWGVAH